MSSFTYSSDTFFFCCDRFVGRCALIIERHILKCRSIERPTRPRLSCVFVWAYMCVHVDTGASQESHNPPEWLICALWNIVEYQAYFMIQPSAGLPLFLPASGFICETKPVLAIRAPLLPSSAEHLNILDM